MNLSTTFQTQFGFYYEFILLTLKVTFKETNITNVENYVCLQHCKETFLTMLCYDIAVDHVYTIKWYC